MDYGKTAYYKAEELEQRMLRRGSGFEVKTKSVPLEIVPTAKTEIAQFSGGVISVRVRAVPTGVIKVYAGDAMVGEGTGDFTVTAVAAECCIYVQGGVVVVAVDITAAGTNIKLSG